MNFCKRVIVIDRLSDDDRAMIENGLRSGEMRGYTGTLAEQTALKAYFQEFEIATDEELSVLVSDSNEDDLSFTFLLKEEYEELLNITQ